jgi:hypothetical protein
MCHESSDLARISTDEQDSGNQLVELRGWAQRRGLDVVQERTS